MLGGPKKEIHAGDVVHCNCGKKHWHGATDTTGMSHIAVQEWMDGTPVNWLEKVTDEQYLSPLEPDWWATDPGGICLVGIGEDRSGMNQEF